MAHRRTSPCQAQDLHPGAPSEGRAIIDRVLSPLGTTAPDLGFDDAATSRTIRLLTVPARHPYVTAVTPTSTEAVHPERVRGWEPDPIFTPGAVTALADEIDVIHLHFSFDHLDVSGVRAWLAEVGAADLPLVLTAHDLRNPHHDTREQHDQLLAELIPAAAAVITLTPGAAAEIADRFGVTAIVLPHPSLSDPARTAEVAVEPGLAVLHLKSLRRNLIDPVALATAAAEGAARVGGRLQVDLHPEVTDDPRLTGLDDRAAAGAFDLVVHSRFADLELDRYLRRAHVSVLPYRWGTHSGWLELARDLGTRIVAPDCGYYPDQWADVVTYRNNEIDGLDAGSLADAVAVALSRPAPEPAERTARLAEVTAVRRAHATIYRRVSQTLRTANR